MASDKKDYEVGEAADILRKSFNENLSKYSKELENLVKREKEHKKALIPKHKHNSGSGASSATEDIPPGLANPKGTEKSASMSKKCAKCGDMHTPMNKCGEMTKADLVDGKGKQSDNHTQDSFQSPGKEPNKDVRPQSMEDAGSGGPMKTIGPKTLKSRAKSLEKTNPPMAKPPSGINMGTHVPMSKPGTKAPSMKVAKGLMADVVAQQAKDMGAPAPKQEAKVKMPTPEEHADRAAGFAEFMPKATGPAGAKLGLNSPKAAGITRTGPVQNAAKPSKPGIFGRLMGKK